MVLRYIFARSLSLTAKASVSLLRNPFVSPISKKPIHASIDDKVSHIPYSSSDKYPNVIGTINKDTKTPTVLVPIDIIILRLTV